MIRRMITKVFGKGVRLLPTVPEGTRIYAIGDIHGRLDLLEALHQKMVVDATDAGFKKILQIFVGDYVDRGADSKGVIDWLINSCPDGWSRVCLKGNHEKMMQDFCENSKVAKYWSELGGLDTLRSYNVDVDLNPNQDEHGIEAIRADFIKKIPVAHWKFVTNLPPNFSVGDYFFVHAGVRPGRVLSEQEEKDMLWIRKEFLDSKIDFGKVIVHGHTPVPQPVVLFNRINIDTGAFMSDRLTCLVLEGDGQRFL